MSNFKVYVILIKHDKKIEAEGVYVDKKHAEFVLNKLLMPQFAGVAPDIWDAWIEESYLEE